MSFNSENILNGWIDKVNQALNNGYDGLRLSGNTFGFEKEDWAEFIQYEKEIDNVIGKYNMMAICTYSLDKCSADNVIDVVNNHQFALTELKGEWALM